MEIDLSKIPTIQLKAIRSILKNGVKAVAGRDITKKTKELKAELDRMKLLNARRKLIEDTDVGEVFDFDADTEYILGFSDVHFEILIDKLVAEKAKVQREAAIAEKTHSIRIPPMIPEEELDALDALRQGFNDVRNRRNGGGES